MMSILIAIKTWLLAGNPPHYVYLLGGAIALYDKVLSKINRFKSNNIVEQLGNALCKAGLKNIPGVAAVVAWLETPPALMPTFSPDNTAAIDVSQPSRKDGGHVDIGTMFMAVMSFLSVGACVIMLGGCQCQNPANANSPECKLLDIVISCTAQDAAPAAMAVVADVTPAITGAKVDWNVLAQVEKTYGTNAAICAVQRAVMLAMNMGDAVGAPEGPLKALRSNKSNVKKNADEIFARRHIVVKK